MRCAFRSKWIALTVTFLAAIQRPRKDQWDRLGNSGSGTGRQRSRSRIGAVQRRPVDAREEAMHKAFKYKLYLTRQQEAAIRILPMLDYVQNTTIAIDHAA